MKLCFDGTALKQSPLNRNTNTHIKIKWMYTCALLVLIGSIAITWGIKDVNAKVHKAINLK